MSCDVQLDGRADACVAILSFVHTDTRSEKLSHLHARPYSLRQGFSLIHRVYTDTHGSIFPCLCCSQKQQCISHYEKAGGSAQAFVLSQMAPLPIETSLHVLLRRTSGSNGFLWEIPFENFNKKWEQQKYSFSKLVDIDYKYFFIFKCLREENVDYQ